MSLMTNENSEIGWIVGVGASAGGLEALSLFVSNLPETFSGSVIVAQHLAPHAKSMMTDLLQRHTRFPVIAAANGAKIQPRSIYIVPPNYDIGIIKGTISLSIAGEETRPKPSVNGFFESLARAYGKRSVGIILSGIALFLSDPEKYIQSVK
ncbi:MAG: chemotaxis protein CheB, partial [Bdellovibrionota bacterium]